MLLQTAGCGGLDFAPQDLYMTFRDFRELFESLCASQPLLNIADVLHDFVRVSQQVALGRVQSLVARGPLHPGMPWDARGDTVLQCCTRVAQLDYEGGNHIPLQCRGQSGGAWHNLSTYFPCCTHQ